MSIPFSNFNFKSMFLSSMLLFFGVHISAAQQYSLKRSHPLSPNTSVRQPAPDSLTILAIRVAFQKDENRLTTGDGTFSSDNLDYLQSSDVTIDPLPHNRRYFENHLEFAKNYFEKVSGGQITVDYKVLPDTYTLPNKMQAYSPTGKNFTFEKVAKLVQDSWAAVRNNGGITTDQINSQKTAFVIFHAGVGRDIELTRTSLYKTPQDIPSLYFDKNTLGELLGKPDFKGFEINNGDFRVTNSMVLPQTLSRPGENLTGEEFVLQLSLNGLLTASVGSYLGLPDLFNTETGNSGIGRFGLMDGESFFSYRGLFPPEPSAWEKIYLGWQSPFTISRNRNGEISLPAASFHQPNSIAKYALSSSEYFLVENRHRDPDNDGSTITITDSKDSKSELTFNNSDRTFVNQTEEFTGLLNPGVVTDVDNFDFSLPGGLYRGKDGTTGTSDDRQLNGGMLIWHIDEAVIRQRIDNQAVNAYPDRRGVDLEEADGAQDIGQPANSDFSEQARGTAFDFWWNGNDASVITLSGDTLSFYQNRFGPETTPSNDSNSGSRSFFEFFDFSDNQPVASFKIRPVSGDNIEPIDLAENTLPDTQTYSPDNNYSNAFPLQLSLYKSNSDSFLIIPSRNSVYALPLTQNSASPFDFQSGSVQQPYLGQYLILGEQPTDQQINVSSWEWNGSQWDKVWEQQAESNNGFISSLNDQSLFLDFTDQRLAISDGLMQSPLDISAQHTPIINGNYALLSDEKLYFKPGDSFYSLPSSNGRLYSGTIQISENKSGFFLLTDDDLTVFDSEDISMPKKIIENNSFGWPSIVDFNKDGLIDFLFINQETNSLEARNLNGAELSYFPIKPPKNMRFTGTPLIAKTNSESYQIFITAKDSLGINIYSYDEQGQSVEGFPLYVGSSSKENRKLIHPLLNKNTLYAASQQGELKAWKLKPISETFWGGRYGNTPYNKIAAELVGADSQHQSNASPVLVKKETYNWPNPAENFTNLRFQTSSAGRVDVKIITPDGTVVFNKQYESNGYAPEEYRIDTRKWSSGLYLAMVTAHVNGEKEQKMLKMVVIH